MRSELYRPAYKTLITDYLFLSHERRGRTRRLWWRWQTTFWYSLEFHFFFYTPSLSVSRRRRTSATMPSHFFARREQVFTRDAVTYISLDQAIRSWRHCMVNFNIKERRWVLERHQLACKALALASAWELNPTHHEHLGTGKELGCSYQELQTTLVSSD